MGFVATEEAAMEESANPKAKQVREVLVELQLPLVVIEQAIQKISEFGGDIDAIATYALNLSIPQVECIEEHLSDDMISSDEDVGAESEEKWMQPPTEVQSPTVQALKEELWEDPICKLFQKPHAENHTLTRHESRSSTAAGDSVQAKVNQMVTVEAEASCSYQVSMEKPIKKEMQPAAPAAPPAPPAPPPSSEQRETSFLDMGFDFDLVQRAFRQHGEEADDSVLVQFLIDNQEDNLIDNQENNPRLAKHTNEEESDSEEELRARIHQNGAGRSLKAPARSPFLPEFNEDSGSDSDIEPEVAPCNDWEAETSGFVKPASLCSREIPENGGHRAAMQSIGFSPALIERAVQELGKGVEHDMLLEYLLYLSAQQDPGASTAASPPRNGEISTLKKLTTEFQFPSLAVEKAMDRCKTPLWNATQEEIADVVDFLAAHMETLIEEDAVNLPDSDDSDEDDSVLGGEGVDFGDGFSSYWNCEDGKGKGTSSMSGKRKFEDRMIGKGKSPVQRGRPKGVFNGVKRLTTAVSTPMMESKHRGAVGFGLPGQKVEKRHLKEDVKGAPFFYFENVAGMPSGEWERIQMHLFDIKAEFVDAMHFSACRRSRGYIHNLPIEGRKKMIKDPPMTIMELMPQTKPFWPEWDKRTKLNCINTVRASEFLTKRLGIKDGTAVQKGELSIEEQKNMMYWCCKLNLVWTSPNIPSPIEANEIEAMLGFDRDHSRHCFGLTARYKALGNSFSVYTVAYHFSVLKPLYPKGIKVLSLFSGIGGAEVALHKVGINLNVVVSVELEEGARRCLQTWWALTKQEGHLDVDYHDVRHLTRETLTKLVEKYRGFDLIVGGSPCNNLTGNNRHTRTGLEGEHSTMFFEFSRIVSTVRELTIKLQGGR